MYEKALMGESKMELETRIFEILENAYKFNRNPEDTCQKIMDAIKQIIGEEILKKSTTIE